MRRSLSLTTPILNVKDMLSDVTKSAVQVGGDAARDACVTREDRGRVVRPEHGGGAPARRQAPNATCTPGPPQKCGLSSFANILLLDPQASTDAVLDSASVFKAGLKKGRALPIFPSSSSLTSRGASRGSSLSHAGWKAFDSSFEEVGYWSRVV